jgi:DNA-binding CsgD family transcriptional regulator
MEGWPLVGRARELEAIVDAYHQAAPALPVGAAGVMLVGAAGVGKTRLAREAVDRLAGSGGLTAWATATRSTATIPLGALAHLLIDPRPGPLDALGAFVAMFARQPEPRPVLVVDDVHLLDDASAALVHHVAAQGYAFVLLTARTAAAVPDAVTALWTGEAVRRLDVAALDAAETRALLTEVLPGRIDVVSEQTLWHACGGNPLLLREVLRAGRDTGALRRSGALWRWFGGDYVTPRLTDVIHARLGHLDDELRGVVEVLACAEPLRMPLLEAVAEHPAIVEAERRGVLVTERVGDRLLARLPHPVYADVVRATMPRSRELGIWRALVAALDRTPGRRGDDVLYGARWRVQAGLDAPPELLLRAARHARERLDLDLAERLARAAGQAGGGPSADLALAELLADRGRYSEAAAVLPALDGEVDAATRDRWHYVRRQLRYWRPERDGTDETTERDPAAEAIRSWLLLLDGDGERALDVGVAALDLPGIPAPAADRAASAVIGAAGLLGHHDRAMSTLDTALAAAREHRGASPWGVTLVAGAGTLALLAAGRLGRAAELAESEYRAAVGMVSGIGTMAAPLVGTWAAYRGTVAKARGDGRLAVSSLTEAVTLLADFPTFRLARLYLAELAGAAALTGDVGAAREWLDQAEAHAKSGLFDAWFERDRAWVTAAGGDLAAAASQARHAAALARSTGQPTIEGYALFDAARFGAASRVHRRMATLAKEVGGVLVPVLARVAGAWHATIEPATLDSAARELASLGQLLYAAETAMTAHRAHTRAGDRSRAQTALVRATEYAGFCAGARTPLLEPAELSTVLTARERQVADLAAAGLSSPVIASRLGLSVRTVNNHLSRAYAKLGIASRSQLGELFATSIAPPDPVDEPGG